MHYAHIITQLLSHEPLTPTEARHAMQALLGGDWLESQIGGFLVALRAKGETAAELAALAAVMRDQSIRVIAPEESIDVCGTGGDGAKTFNISTAVAFVLAAAGIPVAKHGNRAISSQSGSADVLSGLGIEINLSPAQIECCLQKTGIGFIFAPGFHPGMRHVMPARKALGVRTVFNLLGPLANPARVRRQVIGVFSPDLVLPVAEVLKALGHKHAIVVHGSGLDELALHGPSQVAELRDNTIDQYEITPEDVDLPSAPLSDIVCDSAAQSAEMIRQILSGKAAGAPTDIVLFNSAAGLVVGGKTDALTEGVALARDILNSGDALTKLEALADLSQTLRSDSD